MFCFFFFFFSSFFIFLCGALPVAALRLLHWMTNQSNVMNYIAFQWNQSLSIASSWNIFSEFGLNTQKYL
uniref:Putative secreted protein n=1 Tax=Rhipicephalus microplus TaxID=6941 RepID=A0A6M2DBV0_RHIMP